MDQDLTLIDYNVQVFIKQHFERWRPFPIRDGVLCSSAVFPWLSKEDIEDKKGEAIRFRDSPDKEPPYRYMFCKGNDFIAGLFYGNIYKSKGYCLFEPTISPSKSLYLPDYTKISITKEPFLILDSNFTARNMLPLSKFFKFKDCDEDIQAVLEAIKRVIGSIPNITDQASKDVEMYVRAYHLQHKLAQMDRHRRPVIWTRRVQKRERRFGRM